MSYLQAFTEKIAALDANLDKFNTNLTAYTQRVDHRMIGGTLQYAIDAFEAARVNSEALVDHLKLREAYNNHGLTEDETATVKLLYAAILKNKLQFENAFELHRKISSDKIFELTQNIAVAKTDTDLALKYADILLQAQWKPGSEIPTDEKPKWVWLTDGYFTYMEREAKYNLKENKWEIKRKTSLPDYEIHQWIDFNEE